jgi:hypothetical protein
MKHHPSYYVRFTRAVCTLTVLALISTLTPRLSASPPGSAFTYQGSLADGHTPATGCFDFSFAVYDAITNGNLVSRGVTNAATPVTNGLFTTLLDFGAGTFTGGNRWLQIGVRPTSNDTFAVLSPRQPLTAVPYALYAQTPFVTGTNGVLAGNSITLGGGGSSWDISVVDNVLTFSYGDPLKAMTLDTNGPVAKDMRCANLYATAVTAQSDIEARGSVRAHADVGGATLHVSDAFASNLYLNQDVHASGIIAAWGSFTSDVTARNFYTPAPALKTKTPVSSADCRDILKRLAGLAISSWDDGADAGSRHLGPMAQDFYATFGLGPDDTHIAMADEGGVALAAIRGLNQKLEEELKRRDAESAEMKARLEKLEQLLRAKTGGAQ